MAAELDILTCTTSTSVSLTLYILPLFAIFLIVIALVYRLGFIGFFGSLMLMVSSWYLSTCENTFAFILALFSFVLLIYFIVILPLGTGEPVLSQ